MGAGQKGLGMGAACKVSLCWETTATGLFCFGSTEKTVGVESGEAGAQLTWQGWTGGRGGWVDGLHQQSPRAAPSLRRRRQLKALFLEGKRRRRRNGIWGQLVLQQEGASFQCLVND